MEEHMFDHEKRLGQIEAKVDGILEVMGQKFDSLNEHIEDVAVSQLRDHGKRIGALEHEVSRIEQMLASEKGRAAGSRAMLTLVLSLVGAAGGLIGGMIGHFFK